MSQTVNLDTKYSKKIDQAFTIASLLKGRLSAENEFVGARTVRIHNINTVPLNDYNRGASANRYGEPAEVGDTVQELTMTQDKSFSGVIDKGNNMDQSINKAGKFLGVEMSEEVIPAYDKYCFGRLCTLAGKIVGSADAVSGTNVIKRMSAARKWMLDRKVPLKGRTWYVRSDVFTALVECDQFKNLEKLGTKAVAQGQVGELFGAPVVEVPEDYLSAGVNFILLHKRAATAPEKIHDCKTHIDPPGISGNLVEGRFYYDLFVYGHSGRRVCGRYHGRKRYGAGRATIAGRDAITAAEGATAYYTTDGTDPRYSLTAKAGTAPTGGKGVVVKAYQVKDGAFPSPVATQELTS
ncbi:MAG: chitobiase/beta-hexosaminidase C-terminal domain-containing protein [Ruthenibacterium lactatiformans]